MEKGYPPSGRQTQMQSNETFILATMRKSAVFFSRVVDDFSEKFLPPPQEGVKITAHHGHGTTSVKVRPVYLTNAEHR